MSDIQLTHRETARSRFSAPLNAEKDAGFRATILGFNKNALTAVGILGVVAPLLYLVSSKFLHGKRLLWKYGASDIDISVVVIDKVLIMSLGILCLILSRTRSGPRWGRPVVGLVVFTASMASAVDDIRCADVSFLAGWLALIMFVAVVVPFRAWHTLILCAAVFLGFVVSLSWLPSAMGWEAVALDASHVMFLILVTLVCSVISELIYGGRFQQYQARRMLADTNVKLHEAQSQLVLSAKMASLGNLVAGIAHEVNTPLGAIHSNASVSSNALEKARAVLDKSDTLGSKEMASELSRPVKVLKELNEVTLKASARINKIVTALRNFARLDQAELNKIDLHEAIESTLTILPQGDNKKISFSKEFGNLPEVTCNASQLSQVFINLLLNSVEAIEDEGTITISTCQDGDWAVLEFADSGRGIPQDQLGKVFDPGYTTKGVGVGTGLGLSICYRVMESHKGEIKLSSHEGRGATVTLRLPLK